ncbi:MAG: Fpg/Nei family DNA glycosylase [Actinomycetota bacterium]
MPELPDVDAFRRTFAERAAGRTVRRVVVTDAGILRNAPAPTLDRALRGHRFEEPARHGKWLVCRTDGPAVLIHFGMTGELEWADGQAGRHRYDRVIFVLDRGELRYRDMRKLRGLWLAHDEEEIAAILGPLGPDALTVNRRAFRELLGRRRGRAKAVLMNQGVLSGIGNLLADEILWHARIHPSARVEDLSEEDVDRLHRELRRILRASLRHDRVPARREWLLRVRGLPGATCPRCGTPLARSEVAGRTTYACPRCQPPP